MGAVLLAATLALGACSSPGETDGGDEAMIDDPAVDGGETGDGGAAGDEEAGTADDSTEDLPFGDGDDADPLDAIVDTDVDPAPLTDEEVADLPAPDEVLPEIEDQLEDTRGSDEILDGVDVLDGEDEVVSDRDGKPRNSTGELVTLDEAASLACAHVEIAVTHLDEGNPSVAIERIGSAVAQVRQSERAAIGAWEEPLTTVVVDGAIADLAPLVGFISVCAEGGYEL